MPRPPARMAIAIINRPIEIRTGLMILAREKCPVRSRLRRQLSLRVQALHRRLDLSHCSTSQISLMGWGYSPSYISDTCKPPPLSRLSDVHSTDDGVSQGYRGADSLHQHQTFARRGVGPGGTRVQSLWRVSTVPRHDTGTRNGRPTGHDEWTRPRPPIHSRIVPGVMVRSRRSPILVR
jgi:hypothetical protein